MVVCVFIRNYPHWNFIEISIKKAQEQFMSWTPINDCSSKLFSRTRNFCSHIFRKFSIFQWIILIFETLTFSIVKSWFMLIYFQWVFKFYIYLNNCIHSVAIPSKNFATNYLTVRRFQVPCSYSLRVIIQIVWNAALIHLGRIKSWLSHKEKSPIGFQLTYTAKRANKTATRVIAS